ncbi:hypothetical protein DPMN_000900 [Dreissena polymorpha]|uniref:Uncharacterized protein n=1 Tax=Dreissena polymorpha TaxID=45954 RepID=A0A9D4MJ19_DREPO|nr:hypothetical protein DPMN_000900 [Dreissena polymorpha]
MGPRIEPWGTPQVILALEEKVPETSTSWFLSDKYDLNQFKTPSLRPDARSFMRRIEWSTVSNAFCKSNITMPTMLPLSFSYLIKSVR